MTTKRFENHPNDGPAIAAANRDVTPPEDVDPVIEAYKKDIDRTLLRANLRLTVEQRIEKATSFIQSVARWRGAARVLRSEADS